ncbi:Hypothetical predicted protein [Mytilus galloprovincialis]|uniref:Uncharacterized protein n=1 Tax=Mytilus galloprovincialis TaxID=29158 RepID=A0A8B6EML1_MYTGA|nr:Hypothetical predicted protein [Mytilus galloprovincialis]
MTVIPKIYSESVFSDEYKTVSSLYIQGIPGAFQLTTHEVLTGSSYTGSIQETMRSGGCTCSRGGFIGACFAAQNGLAGIPDTWKEKTLNYKDVNELSQKLVKIPLV